MRTTWLILGLAAALVVGAYLSVPTETDHAETVITAEQKAHVDTLMFDALASVERAEAAQALYNSEMSEVNRQAFDVATSEALTKLTEAREAAEAAGIQLEGFTTSIPVLNEQSMSLPQATQQSQDVHTLEPKAHD